VLMGILAGGYHPSAPPLISASVRPEKVGRAFGFHNIGGGASHFLTPLAAVAITNAWGWRNAYVALGIPTFAFGILFYILLGRLNARQKKNPAPQSKEGKSTLVRPEKRRLVVFLILTTFASAIINSILAFVPLLMVDHFGISKEMAAGSLSVVYSAVFWASPLGGYLSDRFGSIRMILMVCFIAGPVIYLLTVVPYGWMLGVLLLLLGAIIYTRMSSAESFIVHRTPVGSRSTILGIYYFSGMESGGVLMPLLGFMIDHLGFAMTFTAAGGVMFLATLICSFWLRERDR
jgi:FSR family fosmidomycin resistance protein-like MFS transporter